MTLHITRIPNGVHMSSLHHTTDQAFSMFSHEMLKLVGMLVYKASTCMYTEQKLYFHTGLLVVANCVFMAHLVLEV